MRRFSILLLVLTFILFVGLACGGGAKTLKLGDAPLTVQVDSADPGFDGLANIYINGQFIGTTDATSQSLKINLKKGDYLIVVAAEGYTPWRTRMTLLGANYKQTALARLTVTPPDTTAAGY